MQYMVNPIGACMQSCFAYDVIPDVGYHGDVR